MPEAVDPKIPAAVGAMKQAAGSRDDNMARVKSIRDGDMRSVWPEHFSDRFPQAIVANFVDVAARDLAANLSPLPALQCSAGTMRTAADKRRAEKKNRIGSNYWRESRLEFQMKYGADQYLTYGFLPFVVDPDFDRRLPIIHVLDPVGCYYQLDRWGECRKFSRTWTQDKNELALEFPDKASAILNDDMGRPIEERELDVVHYVDDKVVSLYLPGRKGLLLAQYEHRLGFCPVHIALRPGLHQNPRGLFDDVLFVQLAHAVMAALTLEAGHKSVQAPIAVPSDMNDLNIGPDALMVTDSPEKIQRVPLNVPQAAFALSEQLSQEMKEGAGYPDTRLGHGPSTTTGRGISALEGGFDTQIKLGQDVLALAFRVVTEMCFAMDKALWPSRSKTIRGTLSGESFELTYRPGADISDDTACEVTYGFASGVSPASAIVTLLQLRGDGVIGRDMFRKQLPFDIDVDQAQREVDVQAVEDALKQGLAGALQASGQMIAAGQTDQAMQFFQAAAQIIKGRQQGDPIADLVLSAFQELQQKQQQEAQAQQDAMAAQAGGAPGGPGGAPGMDDSGLPEGTAPGQAGMGPGGRPSIQDLTAGFVGGRPAMNASVKKRLPAA